MPLAAPVMRQVERIELPSIRAATIWVRLDMGSVFISSKITPMLERSRINFLQAARLWVYEPEA